MRKQIRIVLSLIFVIALSACGSSGVKKDDIPGKYTNVGAMAIADWVYTINDNGTFETAFSSGTKYHKGTWNVSDDKKKFWLDCKDVLSDGIEGDYVPYGEFFYKKDKDFGYWMYDEEYGTTVQFNSEGRTEQTFHSNYFSYKSGSSYKWYCVDIVFHNDGTFGMKKYIRNTGTWTDQEELFKGNYSLNDKKDIITLSFDGTDHYCILVDDRIYYSVLKKVQ